MEHELHFEKKKQTIVFRTHGEFTVDDAHRVSVEMQEMINENGDCSLITDLRDSPPTLDKEVRKALQNPTQGEGMVEMTMITSNPGVRMMGKIVISIMGKSKDTRFFKTKEEAWNWIESETSSRIKRK